MRLAKTADVYWRDERAGEITRSRSGSVFRYDAEFLAANASLPGIAFNLPRHREVTTTTGVNLHPFFAGLLPEGLRLKAVMRVTKTSEDDLLSLLIRAGADCIGDVSVVSEGSVPVEAQAEVDVSAPQQTVFSEVLERSLRYARGTPPDASIPGVQAKVSAAMISVPVRGAKKAKRYILKLNPPDHPRLVENEAFFMKMAGACGIDAASTQLVHDQQGQSGLLVERFDRRTIPHREKPEKVHQEDLCQVLNRYPADKYSLDMADIVDGLSVCTAPLVESLKLLRIVAFSYLIGNGDLHAKNVSVRRLQNKIQLTPAYDLLSSLPYGDRSMAILMDGRDKRLKGRAFVDFGERHGIRERATRAMLADLLKRASPWFASIPEIGLSERKARDLQRTVEARATELSASGTPS